MLHITWRIAHHPVAIAEVAPPRSWQANYVWQGITAAELAMVAVAYALGQATSLCFRSNIVATLVAIVGIAPFFFWHRLVTFFALPPLYTMWPLAIGLLAASAVFAPRWLLDRRGPVTWLRVGGTFGLFAGGVLAIVPELRLQGIDDVQPNFDLRAFEATLDAEAQATATRYREALMAMRLFDPNFALADPDAYTVQELTDRARSEQFARLKAGTPNEADRRWLDENKRPIELAREANERPTCAFLNGGPAAPGQSRDDLLNLLLLRGVAAENRLEASQTAIGDALRLIRHIRPDQRPADALERRTLEFVLAWAIWPGQTPERLAAVRQLLADYGASLPDATDSIKLHYLELLRSIDRGKANYHDVRERWLLEAPWERTRAKRLLNLWINDNLLIVDSALDKLRAGSNLDWMQGFSGRLPHDLRVETTPYLAHDISGGQRWGYQLAAGAANGEARRRAAQVILALVAERLRSGELPASLEALKNEGVSLPKDPFTAQDFRYYPQGFPVTLEPNVQLGARERLTLASPQPLIWSPSLAVQVVETQENGRLETSFRVENARGEFEAVDNDAEAFVRGFTYAIPMASPPSEAESAPSSEQSP